LYHLRKFARRHKALLAGVVGVLAALLAGTVVSILFAVRAGQNAQAANDKERLATYETYRARLAAAVAALSNHDVADAARHLEVAPQALRGWEWRHLHSRLDDSIVNFPALPGRTFFLSRGAEGLGLVIPGDQSVRVLDDQGRTERTFPFPHREGGVWAVAQTPEGLLLLEHVSEVEARLRDETGRLRLSVKGAAGAALGQLALSPSSRGRAVPGEGPAGFSTVVYDSSSGKEQARLPDLHTHRLWSLSFSPDGTRLASASEDGTARLWDVATGRPVGGPLHHLGKDKVVSAAFSPNGQRLVTASADGTVSQWDTQKGDAVEPPYERHTGEVWTAVYSPNGEWIASGGTDRTVRLWRAAGRQEALVLHGHTGRVGQLAFTGDGRRLCSVSEDGTVRVWEANPQDGLPVLR